MSYDNTECPNCRAKIKDSLMSSNQLFSLDKIKIINEFTTSKGSAYCGKCGSKVLEEAMVNIVREKIHIENMVRHLIDNIPMASIQSPINWDYEVIGIVTGQSATGTGVFSDAASSFTDIFGGQSGTISRKLRGGESMCMSQLRARALEIGANAVLGVDIDYAEFGGDKSIVTVCMTGTAVLLKNTEILGEKRTKILAELRTLYERIGYLTELSK